MLLKANADIEAKDKVSRILCVYMCPKVVLVLDDVLLLCWGAIY